MKKQIFRVLVTILLLSWLLVGCGSTSTAETNATTQQGVPNVTSGSDTAVTDTTATNDTTSTTDTTETNPDSGADSVAEAAAANAPVHEDETDYVWDSSNETEISLSGDAIGVTGQGVTVNGSVATITAAGTYTLSGTLADGQIVVDTESEETVHLILNGVSINSSTSAAINIAKAEEVVIMLADGSENYLADATTYVFASADEDEPNAALFSKTDLTIFGNGTLTVQGNYNDGIASKDGLIIASGTITVTAVDDGIRGKDYLLVKDGTLTINAQGDGLKADNEEDTTLGYISIEAGSFNITAGGDAIQAATDVLISDGQFTIATGGGSSSYFDDISSAKGIKAAVNLNIENGTFVINSADDAVHSNASMVINNGTFTVATGDDGFHADATLTINNGIINITGSYEGIESTVITINGGDIQVVSSDDGINVADGSGAGNNFGGGPGGAPGGGPGGRPGRGQDTFATSSNYFLYINGGTIFVNAGGDGIDVNGSVVMTDGLVLVNGPTEQMNGALDYDGSFAISGGTFLAVGSAGMAQAPGQNSSQNSVLINLNGTLPAGALIHIQTSSGEDVLTFAPTKQIQSISFSSAGLVTGQTYEIYYGGSSTGTATNGLYEGGTYSGGTLYTSITLSGTVTQVGGGFR
ncbi:MAG: carbohydrate-binding domain-containing protein [Ardenticatenaceae bacterium]|nr:carbohydrate-binding domain-containing protein [Ardenticatenaceae bacterium]